LDATTDYGFVRDFVGQLFDVGCRVFIVHARHAILAGLSPRENREVPPLQYDQALALKHDFPQAVIVLNGGLTTAEACLGAVQSGFDGVMLGRAAWHDPAVLSRVAAVFGQNDPSIDDSIIIEGMTNYIAQQVDLGVPLRVLVRPLLGYGQGRRGARQWRRMLSDPALLAKNDPGLLAQAWEAVGLPSETI
jgi:tRNA-dihydrouridine synthase A